LLAVLDVLPVLLLVPQAEIFVLPPLRSGGGLGRGRIRQTSRQ
jgi:hypothetical protein